MPQIISTRRALKTLGLAGVAAALRKRADAARRQTRVRRALGHALVDGTARRDGERGGQWGLAYAALPAFVCRLGSGLRVCPEGASYHSSEVAAWCDAGDGGSCWFGPFLAVRLGSDVLRFCSCLWAGLADLFSFKGGRKRYFIQALVRNQIVEKKPPSSGFP